MLAIVKKTLTVEIYSPSHRIMITLIDNLAIITIYLPYEDGTKNIDELIETLVITKNNVLELRKEQYQICIIGDLNIDNVNPGKHLHHNPILKNFMQEINMQTIDTKTQQEINFTYKNTNRSWIDHIIANSNEIKISNIQIMNVNNRSDHLPIKFEIKITRRRNTLVKDKKTQIPLHITMKSVFINTFIHELTKREHELEKYRQAKDVINKTNLEAIINEAYDDIQRIINDCMVIAKRESDIITKVNHGRSKIWWTERCTKLHEEKDILLKITPRDDSIKKQIKIIDKRIDAIKKNWIKKGKINKTKRLNQDYMRSKSNYWKAMKQSQTTHSTVNITTKALRKEFEYQSNNKFNVNREKDHQNKLILNRLRNSI